jgi:C4-dicarboxylate-binding protein DctP
VNSKTITVNADYWKKLPDEVKDTLKEVAVLYRDHVASLAMDRAAASRAAYEKAGGKIVMVSAGDRTAWASAMPNIAQEWAAGLDAKGKPGSKMLQAYMAKLKAAGMTPARDWTAN